MGWLYVLMVGATNLMNIILVPAAVVHLPGAPPIALNVWRSGPNAGGDAVWYEKNIENFLSGAAQGYTGVDASATTILLMGLMDQPFPQVETDCACALNSSKQTLRAASRLGKLMQLDLL